MHKHEIPITPRYSISIRTVAICGKNDSVMRNLLEKFEIEIGVYNY
jgi:hypothetical protein